MVNDKEILVKCTWGWGVVAASAVHFLFMQIKNHDMFFFGFQGNGKWYELQDLHVADILPQMITLSESYVQVRTEEKFSGII